MTTNYNCDLATNASPDEVASRLQTLLGGRIYTQDTYLGVATTAVDALIMPQTNPVTREWFLEDWEIDSKITISFTLNRSVLDDEYVAGRRDFSVASVRLGEDLDTDALLRFEGDRLMMRRQNGTLTLYDWWPDWTNPEVIAKLPPGYTLTSDGRDTPAEQTSDSQESN